VGEIQECYCMAHTSTGDKRQDQAA